jgi:hypothetical protein
MDRDELLQRVEFADKHIGIVTELFVDKFTVTTGSLDKIGSMETDTKIVTNAGSMVSGNITNSGSFGAKNLSRSTTSEKKSRSINLLKIGSKAFTDVSIPNSGFFEAIDFGDQIGVILSSNEKKLHYIYNFRDGTTVGDKPSCLADLARWIFLGLFLWLAWATLQELYSSIRYFQMPDLVTAMWSIAFFVLYRASHNGSIISRENWNEAVILAQSNST